MLFLASTAFAQGAQSLSEISAKNPVLNSIVGRIMSAIVIPILEGLFLFTFLMFVWGVVSLIRKGDEPEERQKGQQHILWGAVGMFIMISAYGIVRLIANTVQGIDV